jgi:hypothetical protein
MSGHALTLTRCGAGYAWQWTATDGRVVGTGWSSGSKREAQASAREQLAAMFARWDAEKAAGQ